jgi:hypothetical protein
MNKNYKTNERELVKVATFFKRQSRKLIEEGKLGPEHKKVEEAVDHFIEQMDNHANTRAFILEQRESLRQMVKDNPQCPKCKTNDKLRHVGVETNEKGWKSNRYKCRKCNIQFTWTVPNNPWDMILYIEELMGTMTKRLEDPAVSEMEKEQIRAAMESMQGNLEKLRPVIQEHDTEYNALQERDLEMEKLIHEFKNALLIERIKMDTWENKTGGGNK